MNQAHRRRRRWTAGLALGAGLVTAGLVTAPAASAHPLGNFTVNYSSGLIIEPNAVRIDQIVDRAEIPTLQSFPDARPRQTPAGAAEFRQRECAALAAVVRLSVGGRDTPVSVLSTDLELLPGAAGLATSRLTCILQTTGEVTTVDRSVTFQGPPAAGRVGWHEVTARGDGVKLASSDVPVTSPSRQLRLYPADLLTSPLNQQRAQVTVVAGTGVVSVDPKDAPVGTGALYGLDRLTTAYTALVSRTTLTPAFALLAFVLSLLLGGLHAFAPGHGKTLMAAYLVGREGTWRQAAVIGLSVTVTHTVGVLVLGAALSAAVLAAPETVYPWLGLLSGLFLAGIGVSLLRSPTRLLSGHTHEADEDGHGHAHGHHAAVPEYATAAPPGTVSEPLTAAGPAKTTAPHQEPLHGDAHERGDAHGHGSHGHGHGHGDVAAPSRRGSRSGTTMRLAVVGLVGGMVPSPSALIVLLGGIALGRAWFGALLVLAYGIGMAAALVGTGLLLVVARDRVEAWSARRAALRATPSRWAALPAALGRYLPRVTAAVVIVVGLSLAARSALTI